ncbi:MAG: TonB-dependent receptor plug domain-containing protein [Chryseolinea sp.]
MIVRKKTLLKSALIILILAPSLFLFSFINNPNILEIILQKMQRFHAERAQEKLYLHFDKPFYAAGETMWYKAYLVEASRHIQDSQSRVVYVELIDNKKNLVQRQVLFVADGVTFGDLQLSDTLSQGKYLIRAYTNYMKNVGEDFFFKKEFSVLNPTVEPSGNKDLDKNIFSPDSIDLQFFPEGGNLVACGTMNRLAFKALSPDGKSIAVEGEIVDESNTVITTFKTEHDGMGLVQLNPVSGKKYSARITKPYQVNRPFQLPRVNEKGYIMLVDQTAKNIKVVIFTNVDKPASEKLNIGLVVQSRGKIYHAQKCVITSNAYFTYIPRSKFPDGITQITLFDEEARPVAERLIHQDRNETLSMTLKTDSLKYGKRKMVTVYADAMYRNGTAAKANISISVYDESLLQPQEKYPLTINNYLSLTSDLKGNIENPGYYFKDSLPETKKHLDLLMMVNGWRRFTWKDVLDDSREPQKYRREKGVPISGYVLKPLGKKAPEKSNLKIMTMKGAIDIVQSDSLGRFYSDGLQYYDSMNLVVQTENDKGKKQPYRFFLNPFNPSPLSEYSLTAFTHFDAKQYLEQHLEQKSNINLSQASVLKEVEVVAKKVEESDSRLIGSRSKAIDAKKLGGGYQSILQMIQARVAGVTVSGNPPDMTVKIRGKDPAILLNGMLSSVDMINLMLPSDVDMIEVIKGPGALIYGSQNVINVVLKEGASWDRVPIGMNQVKYPGFFQGREFYSPRYDVPDEGNNLSDKRTTLFWEPLMEMDDNGKAVFSFFTADIASRYRIVMEGITPDGFPGTSSITFDVK